MKKLWMVGLFCFVALSLSGCASNQKEVRALQAQVGVITDELVRLDSSLQDTRQAIVEEENKLAQLKTEVQSSEGRLTNLKEEESVMQSIYRTPSGFELPSLQIQQALKNAGYYKGSLDGKIGPATRKSVRKFQADNGLTADGVVGRKTWAKLKAYLYTVK